MKRKHGLSPMERIERKRTVTKTGCWETPFIPSKPYPSLKIEGRHVLVHRIAYETLVGPIPEGQLVCHRCDNPRCHNPEHLFLGDHAANLHDMIAKGRQRVRGPSPHTEAVLALAHLGQEEIAQRVGITQSAVSAILRKHGLARGRQTLFGKGKKGAAHGRAKIPESAIPLIRGDTRPRAKIAADYGVAPATIYAIQNRTNWAHVE